MLVKWHQQKAEELEAKQAAEERRQQFEEEEEKRKQSHGLKQRKEN